MRTWIIALAALLVLPAVGAAATIAVPPVPEQLVEGHTVFTVIEVRKDVNITEEEFHAAVAVLVREVERRAEANRFPGVLWFNDQYLVNPTAAANERQNVRYPCTGAVLATGPGNADPRASAATVSPLAVSAGGNYVESYFITDPNDNVWDVDKWDIAGTLVWTVAIKNNQAGYNIPDDGESNCAPYKDRDLGCTSDNACLYPYKDPGENGYGHPCGLKGDPNCPDIRYNALLYVRLDDLTITGMKDHEETDLTSDYWFDASGCHEPYPGYPTEYPCPDDQDDREGNSHPYNPELPFPLMSYAGRNNHGGSGGDCDGDGVIDQPQDDTTGVRYRDDYTGDYMCHATVGLDIYFDYWQAPITRDYYLIDVVGSAAPYHCHDTMVVCDPASLAVPSGVAP